MFSKLFFAVLTSMAPALRAIELTHQDVIDANINEVCSVLRHHRNQRKTKTTYRPYIDAEGHERVKLSDEVFAFDKERLGRYQAQLQERAASFMRYADDEETKKSPTYCYGILLRTDEDSTDDDYDADDDTPCSRTQAMSFFICNRRFAKNITIFPPTECRRIGAVINTLAQDVGRFAQSFDALKDSHPTLNTK